MNLQYFKGYALLSVMLLVPATSVWSQTMDQYSILPETVLAVPPTAPNILVVFDNSTSMTNILIDDLEGGSGASNEGSRSYVARKGMQEVLTGLTGIVNMGLMSYQTELDDGSNPLRGGGELHKAIAPLSGTHLAGIREALLPEDGDATSNTILSVDHTAMEGSLRHAHQYLTGQMPHQIQDIDDKTVILNQTGLLIGSISVDFTNTNACPVPPVVILVTDGLPSSAPSFGPHSDNCSGGNLECSKDAAQDMLTDSGIRTYVIGFASEDLISDLNELAVSGGTSNSYFADSTESLVNAFRTIVEAELPVGGSNSGISVIANSSEGAGLVVQASYDPITTKDITDPNTGLVTKESVAWTGSLIGVFIDEFGYLREDDPVNGVQGKLDGYTEDRAFRLVFNEATLQVDVELLGISGIGTNAFSETVISTTTMDDLNPIWAADKVLSSYSDAAVYGDLQRLYTATASDTNGYRHIIGWMADDPNNINGLHQGTQLQFQYAQNNSCDNVSEFRINDCNYLMFGPTAALEADKELEVKKVIRFIRGQEGLPGTRSRTIGTEKLLLGDIVHSSAAQIGAPASNFDLQGDDSYTLFKETFEDRRRMVYVGSNGGLLHGFNAGFWDGENKQFNLESATGGETEHELGAEIWAFAPMNLLPHLKFFADPSYNHQKHIAYVDGAVQSFDVRAWSNNDLDHPNGWGTIIVAAMRLGGGAYPNLDWNAKSTLDAAYTSRSAYVVMDVTDPESPPKVIAEITHPEMGFTSGQVAVTRSNCDTDPECDWHLVIGSGATDLTTVTSAQDPRLFRYRLDSNNYGFEPYGPGGNPVAYKAITGPNGFVGDLNAVDWNNNYNHDAIYFGTVEGDETVARGAVYRYKVSDDSINILLDTNRPVPYSPVARRQAGKEWVLFGTGRYFTLKDVENTERNRFYGVIEPRDVNGDLNFTDSILSSDLTNVTGVGVDSVDGSLSPIVASSPTFTQLKAKILSDNFGWQKRLPIDSPSRKISAAALTFRNFLFFTDYNPPDPTLSQCTNKFGESFLNVVDISTGTASFTPGAVFDGPLGLEGQSTILKTQTKLGFGYASQSSLFPGADPKTGKPRLIIKTPLSTGEIKDTVIALPPGVGGRTSWTELEIQ